MLVKRTKLEKLLTILKDGNWHSSDELAASVSFRFGDTVFKARKKGYFVEKRQVAYNQFEYRLSVQ
ncbi:MAG: hypothetical protein HC903_22055 [Methylacidiphilales bacterium]|nr:hypothetical protein [Candidatus Methylacidiphilales bacterium]NJR16625.1 hypothetical protein [Calothrix sp. CSU_2_0]